MLHDKASTTCTVCNLFYNFWRIFFPKIIQHLPIYTGNIYHYINHVTAQLIWLHVHRGTVCCNVDFADYIEEKSFFNAWVLQKEKEFGWIFKITAFLKSQVEFIHFHILSSRKWFKYKHFRGLISLEIQDLEHILYKYNTLVAIVHINITELTKIKLGTLLQFFLVYYLTDHC